MRLVCTARVRRGQGGDDEVPCAPQRVSLKRDGQKDSGGARVLAQRLATPGVAAASADSELRRAEWAVGGEHTGYVSVHDDPAEAVPVEVVIAGESREHTREWACLLRGDVVFLETGNHLRGRLGGRCRRGCRGKCKRGAHGERGGDDRQSRAHTVVRLLLWIPLQTLGFKHEAAVRR